MPHHGEAGAIAPGVIGLGGGSLANNVSNVATNYVSLTGPVPPWPVAADNRGSYIVSSPGLLRRLVIRLNGVPGGVDFYTFTVQINGVNTGITLVIPGGGTFASDLVNTAAVVLYDLVRVECVPSVGVPFARRVLASLEEQL